MFRASVSVTFTEMLGKLSTLNPSFDASTLYDPGGSRGKRYFPALEDDAVVVAPVARFVAVILAPTTRAPLESVTTPEIAPVAEVCATQDSPKEQTASHADKTIKTNLWFIVPHFVIVTKELRAALIFLSGDMTGLLCFAMTAFVGSPGEIPTRL